MSNSLIDTELLEKLQMHFSKANNVYLVCMDRERNILAGGYGSQAENDFFNRVVSAEVGKNLLSMVEMSQIESIVEEELEIPYIKVCAVINRIRGSMALVWIVSAVIEEKIGAEDEVPAYVQRTTEDQFYRSVAFLETLSKQMFALKEHEINARESLEQAVEAEERFKYQLYRSEAMTRIVHLMEKEDAFASICEHAIQEVCDILQIDGGCMLAVNPKKPVIELIGEFTDTAEWNIGNRLHGKNKREVPFFDGRPYMLSSDSMMPKDLDTFFRRYHLSAGIFQPIELNGKNVMYLCFYEFDKNRIWNVDDIKFMNDTKRVLQGILERRAAKESLANMNASLDAVLENLGSAVYVADYQKKEVLYTNQEFRRIFASDTDKKIFDTYFMNKEFAHAFIHKEIYFEECNMWLDVQQAELTWTDGRQVCLGTIFDITDKKIYQQEIEHQISIDHLTGLFNRMRCEQDLEHYIKEAEKTGKEGAFLWIDVDDFQNINAGLGHHYGDTLLKSIAHNLGRISGIEKSCYRMSGDEFGIIVHGSSYKELSRICKDLRAVFERPWFLKNQDYYCTMSMGVVCFPTDGNNADDLTRKVNVALKTAKKKGKNCVEFYNEKVETTSFYRVDMEQNMRRATLNSCNEFEVYYQPIMEQNKNGVQCCGAEALVRWKSSELGFILPNDFIPLAEHLGLIHSIGEHVLYEAAKRCKYWNDCGHPEYKVHVNVSAIQLLQPDFITKVRQILTKVRIKPQNVVLEVTESLAIDDMERMKRVLRQLKNLEIKIALDDFGTGYSSMNHIRELPIDEIKLDHSFMVNISEDEFKQTFIKMTAEVAKTMGASVCVEGIEQRKQLECLKDMQIKAIQGYYFGEPMPVIEFEKIFL